MGFSPTVTIIQRLCTVPSNQPHKLWFSNAPSCIYLSIQTSQLLKSLSPSNDCDPNLVVNISFIDKMACLQSYFASLKASSGAREFVLQGDDAHSISHSCSILPEAPKSVSPLSFGPPICPRRQSSNRNLFNNMEADEAEESGDGSSMSLSSTSSSSSSCSESSLPQKYSLSSQLSPAESNAIAVYRYPRRRSLDRRSSPDQGRTMRKTPTRHLSLDMVVEDDFNSSLSSFQDVLSPTTTRNSMKRLDTRWRAAEIHS